MGERGPVPKRKSELNGHRSKEEIWGDTVTRAPAGKDVRIPPASSKWHPIAKRMWNGLKKSGQSRFYEQTDWEFAYSLMDDLTRYKESARRSPEMLKALLSAMSMLLMTEADRRRAGVELQQEAPELASRSNVEDMQAWKERLSSS